MFLAKLNQIRANGDVKAYLKTKKLYLKKDMRKMISVGMTLLE